VKRLAAMGMVPEIPGMGALDMNTAETKIVENTREIVPGMVLAGMELAEVRFFGQARMGWPRYYCLCLPLAGVKMPAAVTLRGVASGTAPGSLCINKGS